MLSGHEPEDWLHEHEAEQSWVFDMAPVRVTPTKNVVAHVQMYSPAADSPISGLVRRTCRPTGDLVVIDKLFVKPDTFEYGIARYLLKESVAYIRGRGKLPVLDRHGSALVPQGLCEKLGFDSIPSEDPSLDVMVHNR